MKKNKIITIGSSLILVIGMLLAGCASMQLQYLETETVDGPKQVRQGQAIEPRSITVWGIYKDGSRKVVSVSSGDITFNRNTPGPQTVKVRVGTFTKQEVSFETEVMALRSISVASPPRVALFKVGTEVESSWPGLEILGEWDQMGSHRINVSETVITGYMKDQPGKQTIRVSFQGLITTFDVDVRGMISLQITQPPAKLDYFQGDALELAGLKVMGMWEGFPPEELAITRNDVVGYSPNDVGVQRLTVTKNERSDTFSVEVMALTSIVLEKPPTKTVYKVGEELDLTGIMVMGHYTGADPTKRKSELIPLEQLTAEGFDPNRIGRQQRVSVIVRGQTANFFVDINLP